VFKRKGRQEFAEVAKVKYPALGEESMNIDEIIFSARPQSRESLSLRSWRNLRELCGQIFKRKRPPRIRRGRKGRMFPALGEESMNIDEIIFSAGPQSRESSSLRSWRNLREFCGQSL
jgi:hypothetical protein